MKLLNVGCGKVFHKDWVNIDVAPYSSSVQSWDLRKGISFATSYFDAVYHSHLLEHLKVNEAKYLIEECFRVLKPKGILRVVVPDLELIVRQYLTALEKVEQGIEEAQPIYDWMMLELYDQCIRTCRGGEMLPFLRQPSTKNQQFIKSRLGLDAEILLGHDRNAYHSKLWEKIKSQKTTWFIQEARNFLGAVLVLLISGNRARRAFKEGLFRNSGEIHQWMYDRFSLRRMLTQVGFIEVQVVRADESRIRNFNSYSLDVIEGQVRKPDSLFIEGVKP